MTGQQCKGVGWSSHTSYCESRLSYLSGFRTIYKGSRLIATNATCCDIPAPYNDLNSSYIVENQDWRVAITKTDQWSSCPKGFFLFGLNNVYETNTLLDIKEAVCVKPGRHPRRYGDCYIKSSKVSRVKGVNQCDESYFVTAIFRGNCEQLSCIQRIRCCQLVPPDPLVSFAQAKQLVMEDTLTYLRIFSHILGYSEARGLCNFEYRQKGDEWFKFAPVSCRCKHEQTCLSLKYGDWGVDVEGMEWGPVSENEFQEHINFLRDSNIELGRNLHVGFEWTNITYGSGDLYFRQNPERGSFGKTYMFRYERKRSDIRRITATKMIADNKVLNLINHGVKNRNDIYYTANVTVEFSAQINGFLGTTEYIHGYKNKSGNSEMCYKFGELGHPFYADLHRHRAEDLGPWVWEKVKKNDLGDDWKAERNIKRLGEKSMYAFSLQGELSDLLDNVGK